MLRPIRPLLAISGCLLTLAHAFDGESRLVPGCRNFLTAHAISRRSLQQEPRALLLTRPGLPSGRFRESAERATGENTNGDLKRAAGSLRLRCRTWEPAPVPDAGDGEHEGERQVEDERRAVEVAQRPADAAAPWADAIKAAGEGKRHVPEHLREPAAAGRCGGHCGVRRHARSATAPRTAARTPAACPPACPTRGPFSRLQHPRSPTPMSPPHSLGARVAPPPPRPREAPGAHALLWCRAASFISRPAHQCSPGWLILSSIRVFQTFFSELN